MDYALEHSPVAAKVSSFRSYVTSSVHYHTVPVYQAYPSQKEGTLLSSPDTTENPFMRATRGVAWATNTLQARPADRNLCSCRRFYVPEPVSILLATLVQGSAGLLSAERAGFASYGPICCGRPGLRHPPLRVLQCAMRFAVHQAVLPVHSGASGFLFGGDCRGGRNRLTWGLCIVFGAQYKRRDAPPDGRGESQHRAAPHRPGLSPLRSRPLQAPRVRHRASHRLLVQRG